MLQGKIVIKGAREHNLKNISVEIPRDKLVVFTGLSGSGKSSLAFDTIYAEGQRRYVESLSAYARQFLGQMSKPDVDYIEGLSPAISIDQKTTSRNPRSTVGTVTEIYDYLRLLYARIGRPYCPHCQLPITQQTVQQIVDQVLTLPKKTRFQVLAPVVRGKKGEHKTIVEDLRSAGYVRVRVNGTVRDLSEDIILERNKKHTIEVVVDRLIVREGLEERLADSLETAVEVSGNIVIIEIIEGEEHLYSTKYACPQCGFSIEELEPRMFSFNSPYGACSACDGLGANREVDSDRVIPDKNLSLNDGAIEPWSRSSSDYYTQLIEGVSKVYGVDLDASWRDLPAAHQDLILYGSQEKKIHMRYTNRFGRTRNYTTYYEGVVNQLQRRYRESTSDAVRSDIEDYMSEIACPSCEGRRLRPESLSVFVGEKNISEVTRYAIAEALEFFEALQLTPKETMIGRQILKEIKERLLFLVNVGLDYLTLSRAAGTLSGGESQRIRLATQIGSGLMGVLYILDEPSIGLHQRDNARLIQTLKGLRNLGNTLIVVEHDEETMREADHIIDIGPGAGVSGGEIVAQGTLADVAAVEASITGQYLAGKRKIEIPPKRRQPNGKWVEVLGARENNLKNLHVQFPLGTFICITGVSGSGKSTLINEILYKGLASRIHRSKARPGRHDSILGMENLDKVIEIDQSPIGRTPRSNPATYTKTFDGIREMFAATPMAKMRGYQKGRFSFNLKGGRCEACSGDGIIKIEMHFLPDVYVPCEVCGGMRYNRETLQIKYKGKSIAEVLAMNVKEALTFFGPIPKIERKLQTLYDVGLGYIKLGQPATQLSGGEAQRVKLATELSRRSNGKTVYILDEPTTGLHMADIDKLLGVLQRLVDAGDTVIVIEHNLDVIKSADYIIDLGPEGGHKGGQVIATGTPEELMSFQHSYTGQYLKKVLPSIVKDVPIVEEPSIDVMAQAAMFQDRR